MPWRRPTSNFWPGERPSTIPRPGRGARPSRISAGALKARGPHDGQDVPTIQHLDRYGDPDLLDALRRLPDAQRAAVILFYYADLSIRDIAERLGTNSLAVRANLSRGRARLRQLLGDQDD